MLLGQWAGYIAKMFSVLVLLGAVIVYWILMSNFLYHSVDYVYGKQADQLHSAMCTCNIFKTNCHAIVSLNKTPSKCRGYTQPVVRTIIIMLCTMGLSQDQGLLGCDCVTGQVPPNTLKDDVFVFRVKALQSFKMWGLLT